jgi:hypothetical protein
MAVSASGLASMRSNPVKASNNPTASTPPLQAGLHALEAGEGLECA